MYLVNNKYFNIHFFLVFFIMGCQACQSTHKPELMILNELLTAIQSGNIKSLAHCISVMQSQSKQSKSILINKAFIPIKSFTLNFLAYCIVIGSLKCFKYFFKHCGASIALMNSNFSLYNLDPIHILCEKNHLALLEYYLPLYLQSRAISSVSSIATINFEKVSELKDPKTTFTAIQVACLFGNLSIVDFLYNYNLKLPDPVLNIHDFNEETGENCALISIRSGSLVMVKGLNEKYKANFKVCNKFGENAIVICALYSSKYKEDSSFEEIFVYLIEEVGIDPCQDYEEILMLLEKNQMVEYFEANLISKGIYVKKREIDDKWKIRHTVRMRERQQSVAVSQSEISSIRHFSDDMSDIESYLC